jgi:hypothetical protein
MDRSEGQCASLLAITEPERGSNLRSRYGQAALLPSHHVKFVIIFLVQSANTVLERFMNMAELDNLNVFEHGNGFCNSLDMCLPTEG